MFPMLSRFFHAWERRLAAATTDRLVRPFEWGLDWIPANGHAPGTPPDAVLLDWVRAAMANTEQFYDAGSTDDYRRDGDVLSFPSALVTPHPENNVVRARYFPAVVPAFRRASARLKPGTTSPTGATTTPTGSYARRAVLVLPQWNAQPSGHVALCRILARCGVSALRLSLPYHDARMPPELHRADYIVSANVGRTLQVCRQAVLDARRAVAWLAREGYERIGILGTSLGSCLSLLTAAHEPLIRAAALNHVSPYFADVVWRGLSTAHVRVGLDGHIDLEALRALWLPISPQPHLERMRDRRTLLVCAKYDLTFPVDLSRALVADFERLAIPHDAISLPCGHYSSGKAPFSWMDGYVLVRFLTRNL